MMGVSSQFQIGVVLNPNRSLGRHCRVGPEKVRCGFAPTFTPKVETR